MKTVAFFARTSILFTLLLLFMAAPGLRAQDPASGIYFEIQKIKKSSDDMMRVEDEIVKPYIQERIKQGNLMGYGLFKVLYPNGADQPYDYVALSIYNNYNHLQLDETKRMEIARAAFPNGDIPKMIERYNAAEKNMGSVVFVVRDEAFPGPRGGNDKEPRFVKVNHMDVPGANAYAYAAMESEVFKPMHQTNAKAGNLFDWVLLQRILPYGSAGDDDFLTFDIYSAWGDMVAPTGDLFKKVHPDMNAAATWAKMDSLRELHTSEMWEVVYFVGSPAADASYEVVKEGSGPNPVNGQEVRFRLVVSDLKGKSLFRTDSLGYDPYAVLGESISDVFFERGVLKMKKGGTMKITVPLSVQDNSIKNQFGGQDLIVTVDLLDFGAPKPNGAKLLKGIIEKEGLAAAKARYQALQTDNPTGYHFRENDMNVTGYELMQGGNTEAAIYLFELNQKNNPKSWNAWDSLGDGYLAAGNQAKAKQCFEMALKINPNFQPSKDKWSKL